MRSAPDISMKALTIWTYVVPFMPPMSTYTIIRAPTTAKKISVDSTPIEPPSKIGLPKSARLSMKTIRNALAIPGAINGSVMVAKVCIGEARRVCAASSSDELIPSAMPTRTR